MKFLASAVLSLASGLALVTAAPSGDSATAAAAAPRDVLAKRNYTSTYADQLVDGTACRDVTVIWARGTGQQGNIGEPTDVGPEFLNDLAALVGTNSLAAQGVNYSADVEGFEEGGDPVGSELMANLTTLVGGLFLCLMKAGREKCRDAGGVVRFGFRFWLTLFCAMNRLILSALTPSLSCRDTARVANSFTTLLSRSRPRSATLLLRVCLIVLPKTPSSNCSSSTALDQLTRCVDMT